MERNVAKLEEEVLRLKQSSDQANKKCQQMTEKMIEMQQQLDKQSNTIDLSVQDLRQLNHQTELNTKKMVGWFTCQFALFKCLDIGLPTRRGLLLNALVSFRGLCKCLVCSSFYHPRVYELMHTAMSGINYF